MVLSDLDIARWRLRTQHLTRPTPRGAAEVVASLLAVQAENAAQSAWAVATRTTGPDPADLAGCLADGRVLRTHVLRPTWHYVAAADLVWLQEVTAPRVRQTTTHALRTVHDLDEAATGRLADLVLTALEGGRDRTRPQLAEVLATSGHQLSGQALMMLMAELELRGLVCSGAPAGQTHTYALVSERIAEPRRMERDQALGELAVRYLSGHGPATEADLAYWATLTLTDVRVGVAVARERLESFEHDGRTFWHAPGEEPPTEPADPLAHLLQVLDETYRGYQDSRWVLDAARVVPRQRESAIGMALVDGQLVAAMRRTVTATRVLFELAPYPSWSAEAVVPVERAAARYGAFLGREAVVDLR
jgi:hypothetical protein